MLPNQVLFYHVLRKIATMQKVEFLWKSEAFFSENHKSILDAAASIKHRFVRSE